MPTFTLLVNNKYALVLCYETTGLVIGGRRVEHHKQLLKHLMHRKANIVPLSNQPEFIVKIGRPLKLV
jgi:hypothetical protein